MGSVEEPSFSAPSEVVSADGLLFDFDGESGYIVLLFNVMSDRLG